MPGANLRSWIRGDYPEPCPILTRTHSPIELDRHGSVYAPPGLSPHTCTILHVHSARSTSCPLTPAACRTRAELSPGFIAQSGDDVRYFRTVSAREICAQSGHHDSGRYADIPVITTPADMPISQVSHRYQLCAIIAVPGNAEPQPHSAPEGTEAFGKRHFPVGWRMAPDPPHLCPVTPAPYSAGPLLSRPPTQPAHYSAGPLLSRPTTQPAPYLSGPSSSGPYSAGPTTPDPLLSRPLLSRPPTQPAPYSAAPYSAGPLLSRPPTQPAPYSAGPLLSRPPTQPAPYSAAPYSAGPLLSRPNYP
ncbi:hypothetical protein Bbelb_358020 [Branchiostoma belcheri]|nr:hypothetical protein Bbelb_358020 [Branchiostoma belcheri]